MSEIRNRYIHLDMLRGIAAVIVVAEHTRAFLFVPYGELAGANLFWKAFYGATSLGHQAVMIFFALSGFLVGGKAIQHLWIGSWSWPQYALRRLTRLWIVVLPALLLTLVLDWIGMSFGFTQVYSGFSSDTYASFPADGGAVEHSLAAFLGNTFFLQTIAVPVYGSNGPLWSLAYEFWYYVLAMLALSMLFSRRNPVALASNACLMALIVWTLPSAILASGLIWFAGAIAGAVTPALSRYITPFAWQLALLGLTVILLMTVLSELNVVDNGELLLGIVVAMVLPVLALLPPSSCVPYHKVARGLAEVSYTLYVMHFPILMTATMIFFAPVRFLPGMGALAVYTLFIVGALIAAIGLWACFEKHTDRLYGALAGWLPSTMKVLR